MLSNQASKHLYYIKNNLNDYWYKNGEKMVLDCITKLEELCVDTTNFRNRLEKLKSDYDQNRVNQEIEYQKRYFEIYNDNCHYSLGEIVKNENGVLGKVIKAWKHKIEDGLSIGYLDDEVLLFFAKCDTTAITKEDKAGYEKMEKEQKQKGEERKQELKKLQQRNEAVRELFKYLQSNGTLPSFIEKISGDVVYDTFNIYSSGEKIIINEDENIIYTMLNNGMDGDDWSRSNYGNTITRFMQIDAKCKELINIIKIP